MDFNQLIRVDPRLLNHSRLLHSMITGALWPLNASVYHVQTTQAETYAETLASQILIQLQQPVPLVNVSSLLRDIVMRVSEVIDIVVQDSDSSSPDILSKTCNTSALLINSTFTSQEAGGSVDSECYLVPIRNHRIFNVTSSSFEVSWSVNSMVNHSFQIKVYKGKEFIQGMETTDTKLDVFGLEAGVMYTVKISYEVCGKNITSYRNVKTDALVFGITIRILNFNFTDQLLHISSIEYQTFSNTVVTEIGNSFPSNMFALYKTGKLKVQMDSLKTGSIIVRLKIIIEDPQFPKDLSAFETMISSLHNSSVLLLDPQSTIVEDWDECASRAENDCCKYAQCINTIGSYMCRCKTDTDANPSRPGRNCEGEIVDPVTGMVPTFESITEGLPVTSAPSLSVEKMIVTSFTSKSSETSDILPVLLSSGTQESSTPPTDETLPTSFQRLSTSGSFRNNTTTSEIPLLVTEQWDSITTPNGNLTEEGSTVQEQHNSSLSTLPTVLNTTVYASVRNGSLGDTSTHSLLPDGSSQRDQILDSPVTEHPNFHALNHSLDNEMGTDNSSWSEKKSPTWLPASSEEQSLFSTTVASLVTDCGAEKMFFSNVTSTSFHVVWTTDLTLNHTFQFLLLEGKHLIQEVKTQSNNLTISRLEPGILYTVEIRIEVCGNKSKPIQRKVKTAAQKFNGTVRIKNLNYSSNFCNSSSEEYQNFTQLFLTEVRTSLPLNILQEMDADVIKMLITSVTNGSIVVNFTLLIATDMDARNVSGAFLDALQHSSHFMVDNSSLSVHDYDECEREETDCSPDASCNNTYGSYECHCKEGFANVNAERPGRNCEVLLPNHHYGGIQTKGRSSTVLPLTYPYTPTHLPSPSREDSSVSTAIISPAGEISIKNAVQVLCEIGRIVISIRKVFLKQESMLESSIFLGKPHCNVSSSNSSHVVLRTGWNECGTLVQSNTTHTIVKSMLRNDKSGLGIVHHSKVLSTVHCVFQNDVLTSSGYTPEGVYTIFEDLHGSGRFLTAMQLFIGNSPIPKNFSISASDDIMIEVGMKKDDDRLKVVVSECWATPSNNSMDHLSFPFIRGSCPISNTHTSIIANGVSNKARFKLKIFSFVNDSVVYLHCKIHICVEIVAGTCKTFQVCQMYCSPHCLPMEMKQTRAVC
ncbi:uromodulin-like 1 isoform X2 [Hemicordylus capensis]|uniref:uromodulin-like 1 isoform X2 n=1 Tax=Hemicordylus capensis TaxID=884348 RepID=UPI0023046A6F|nr:uromodulin-like 1 isoform X2 [Hemicordylus capensis]